MIESRLEALARRSALAASGHPRTEIRLSAFLFVVALFVAFVAALGGRPATVMSTILLFALAGWSFQRAGYLLLLEERSGDDSRGTVEDDAAS